MKNIVLLSGVGIVLFAVTIFGLLAAQGRLNHEGTKDLPLLAALFPAPADIGSAETPPQGTAPPPKTDSGIGLRAEKPLPYRKGTSVLKPAEGGEHGGGEEAPAEPANEKAADKSQGKGEKDKGEKDKSEKGKSDEGKSPEFQHKVDDLLGQGQYHPGRLFDFPRLEGGISIADLNEILRRAKEAQLAADQERAALARQKTELEAREADVRDRYEAVSKQMVEVEQQRAQLNGKIEEFYNTVVLIQPGDEQALKENARQIGTLEPQKARDVLLSWWKEGQDGQTRVLKLWSVMSPEAADAILAQMEAGQIREILDKRLSVLRAKKEK